MKRTRIPVEPQAFPEAIARLLRGAAVWDSSCSPEARVCFIDREEGLFLKTAPAGTLRREAAMTAWFHRLGLSAEVLLFMTEGETDYLLTRRIPGEDCLDSRYLGAPERLCDTLARLLRQLHETDPAGCPVQNRNESYRDAVVRSFDGSHYEPELFQGLWEFGSFAETCKAAEEGFPLLRADALLHGDYCLPNILLRDWKLAGYIDLGSGGLGDRHIDLLWGIWTLRYNLHTACLTDRFLDAYGRDRAEPDKLRLLAAMEIIGG